MAREIPVNRKKGVFGKIEIKKRDIFLARPETSIAFAIKNPPRKRKIKLSP